MSTEIPGLSITNEELKTLFDWLDRPNPPPCTHTFKETSAFLASRGLPVRSVLEWLGENGAGCDCEGIPGSGSNDR